MEERSLVEWLPCESLVIDGGTQVRIALSETIIEEYADALRHGDQLPPVDVYFDGDTYWLADGFHRLEAARRAGYATLAVVIHTGGKREALWHGLGANETPGLSRTDADRRHAVQIMLADVAWREWSNREIARQCSVSEFLVESLRHEAESAQAIQETPERPLPGGPMLRCMRRIFTRKSHTQGGNPWTISVAELQQHAECCATFLRTIALAFAILTVIGVVCIAIFALSPGAYLGQDIKWAIARLSVLVLLAALLVLITRIVWNFSNVWLGRAGTLEDLILALRLIGMSPADTEVTGAQVAKLLSKPLLKEDADRLHAVVQSLERLRRSFEGKLLEGPPGELRPPPG